MLENGNCDRRSPLLTSLGVLRTRKQTSYLFASINWTISIVSNWFYSRVILARTAVTDLSRCFTVINFAATRVLWRHTQRLSRLPASTFLFFFLPPARCCYTTGSSPPEVAAPAALTANCGESFRSSAVRTSASGGDAIVSQCEETKSATTRDCLSRLFNFVPSPQTDSPAMLRWQWDFNYCCTLRSWNILL